MLRFGFKAGVLVLLIVFSNLAWYVLLPTDPNNGSFLAAINDKYARLHATPAPRIIFVGSSEVAFGIDSARIEEAFGLPVINLGLHIGIGIRTTLESLRTEIQPGDIIIVSGRLPYISKMEFYGFNDGTGLHLWMLKYQPAMLKAINTPKQWLTLLHEYPTFIKVMRTIALSTKFRDFYPLKPVDTETIYRRNGFNEYGDLVSHFDLPAPPWNVVNAVEVQRQFETDGLDPAGDAPSYFNDYQAFVEEQGATIYFMWTPRQLVLKPSPDELAAIEQDTQGITISPIGSPANYYFPDEYYFDTPPHLHKIGRAARTEQLIKDLTPLIGQPAQME